jgi:hypothetical protein
MLTDHFRDPRMLDRIQSTAAAPYLDVFADALTKAGYKRTTIQRYLGAAAHLSFWQQSRARLLTELDGSNVGEFKQHLLACKCVGFRRVNALDARGARLFLLHLQKLGVIATATVTPMPSLFVGFCDWMRQYRGTRLRRKHPNHCGLAPLSNATLYICGGCRARRRGVRPPPWAPATGLFCYCYRAWAYVLAISMPFVSTTSIGSRPPFKSLARPVGWSICHCRKKSETRSYITWQLRVRL